MRSIAVDFLVDLNGAAIGENIDPLDSKYPEIEEIQKRG